MANSKSKSDIAWESLIEKYPEMLEEIDRGGVYYISAESIKEFREPRLMTKWDTKESVPSPLKKRGLNLLPVSRSEFAIADFSLYEDFPIEPEGRPKFVTLPEYETLSIGGITSEANAINAMVLSGILDDFLEQDETVETFNGRMGSGAFEFEVDRRGGGKASLSVNGAQLEIDGGFENDESVVIMEAKNIQHENFHVRQLYYPYRKYKGLVKKPIRLVFSQYTNLTYHLFEYEFLDLEDYSSVNLVKKQSYTFEDNGITSEELWALFKSTRAKTDDNQEHARAPFIQADRFDRLISLCERLSGRPEGMTTIEIAEFMGLAERQANYYSASGAYLGIFDRPRGRTILNALGKKILGKKQRDRNLAFARLMFEHEILRRFFMKSFKTGVLPSKQEIIGVMAELNVCNPGNKGSMWERRSSSVLGWIKWLMCLPDA